MPTDEYFYPTPTASIYDDLDQYIGLLLGAVDAGLDRRFYWLEAEYESDVKPYLEDVRAFIAELPDMLLGLSPIGAMMQYPGTTPPTNWLICDGSEVAEIDYPDLASVLTSDGGIITLPDMRGRAAVGAGTGAGLTARTLLAIFGNETHTLTVEEIPAHDHPQRVRRSSVSGTEDRVMTSGATGSVGLTNGSIDDTGGGAAHNNIQPSLAVNYIIRAK